MMSKHRVTTQDVAEQAGVSRATVSFVLNDVPGMRISPKTRRRVKRVALQLNYHPDATARRMVSGQTHVLGFVMRQTSDQTFADTFLPQVLNGLSYGAAAMGYHILFEPIAPDNKTSTYARLIHERHVDGIVLSGPRIDDRELSRIHVEGAPIVLMGQLPGTDIPFVDVDNIGGAEQATRHLINLGHRRIALITNAPPAYTASVDRQKGYRRALTKAHIKYTKELVRYGNFTPQSGFIAMNELLDLHSPPTAVFIASDTVAFGALHAIRRRGLHVPQDLALVGFDDVPLSSYIDPPLTTLCLPAYQLGRVTTDLLVRLIRKEPIKHTQILLETKLIIRESCGACLR